MTEVDFHHLVTMPERDFVTTAWAAFDPKSQPGAELETRLRAALASGESRKVMVLRLWTAVRARTGRTTVHLRGGRLARAANLAQRVPAGLPLLSFLLGLADSLSGRKGRRRVLRQLEALRIQERLLDDVDALRGGLARADSELKRIESDLTRRAARLEGLGDDLTRRVDMMTGEARQALESAALGLAEKQALIERIEAGTRRPV